MRVLDCRSIIVTGYPVYTICIVHYLALQCIIFTCGRLLVVFEARHQRVVCQVCPEREPIRRLTVAQTQQLAALRVLVTTPVFLWHFVALRGQPASLLLYDKGYF